MSDRSEGMLIGKGLAIAVLGTAASALLIVALSDLYVGRLQMGAALLACSAAAWFAFRKTLPPYLDVLDARFADVEDRDADHNTASAEPAGDGEQPGDKR